MPRRRELADVADGISGHFISPEDWRDDWALGEIALAMNGSAHREFRFDLCSGMLTPPYAPLEARAGLLAADLLRHLRVRRLPRDWVAEATLTLVVEGAVEQTHVARCQVVITDDLGTVRTSTRRAALHAAQEHDPLVVHGTVMTRIRSRMRGRMRGQR